MTERTPSNDLNNTFDPMVLRAMAKWPDVPECYNWLRLDRRGCWLLRGTPVSHSNTVAFINQHYAADDFGRWYFQNGPQRVFVDLDYTPWVFVLRGANEIAAHTGKQPGLLNGLHVDADGNVLLETDLGIGLLCDRDLPLFVESAKACTDTGGDFAELLAKSMDGGTCTLKWLDREITIAHVEADEVPERFGFVTDPEPIA